LAVTFFPSSSSQDQKVAGKDVLLHALKGNKAVYFAKTCIVFCWKLYEHANVKNIRNFDPQKETFAKLFVENKQMNKSFRYSETKFQRGLRWHIKRKFPPML
jgi:hypothetical protein